MVFGRTLNCNSRNLLLQDESLQIIGEQTIRGCESESNCHILISMQSSFIKGDAFEHKNRHSFYSPLQFQWVVLQGSNIPMLPKMILSLDSLFLLTSLLYRIYHIDDTSAGSGDGHLDYSRAFEVSDVLNQFIVVSLVA